MKGADIVQLRARNSWTQPDLAEAISSALGRKCSGGQVSQWENGKRNIPDDVNRFLTELRIATGLGDEPGSVPLATEPGDDAVAEDEPPAAALGAHSHPTPQRPITSDRGVYVKACTELWEVIATGVGGVGAVTGSAALMRDGEIIAADSKALGEAWGRLAETNDTFRRMLAGMTEGGAWMQVAMVTGTTAAKIARTHADVNAELRAQEAALSNGHDPRAAAVE